MVTLHRVKKVLISQSVEKLQIVRKHESFRCFEGRKQWEFAQFIFFANPCDEFYFFSKFIALNAENP